VHRRDGLAHRFAHRLYQGHSFISGGVKIGARHPGELERFEIVRAMNFTTAEKALSHLPSGMHVFIGSGYAAPQKLIAALASRGRDVFDVEIILENDWKSRRPRAVYSPLRKRKLPFETCRNSQGATREKSFRKIITTSNPC